MKNENLKVPYYVSPEQYSQMTAKDNNSKLGVERIKELCEDGVLPHIKTRGGQYRIKIYEDSVPIEQYEKLKEENTKLKTIIETINNTTKQIVERSE